MRVQRIIFGLSAVIASGAAVPALAQEERGTYEQQMACTPDVWRLCSDQIPDRDRIVSCLRQNTSQLSGACRAVFEANNSMPRPDTRRAGVAQPPLQRMAPAAPPPRYVAPAPAYNDDDDD